jgi:D-beta-D-heptose 7-phosphate kinase/D-beta-D-heptose 1-phosphate adenosyltransferase
MPNHLAAILDLVAQWRKDGQKIVFTNGVFDILHAGHVDYLTTASKLGDRLIVGLNDDVSVKRLHKGPERPINPQQARSRVLGALRVVDAVLIFGEDTPLEIINLLKPEILVKGGDYSAEQDIVGEKDYIVGSREVRSWGGEVRSIPLTPGFSTTNIIQRLSEK